MTMKMFPLGTVAILFAWMAACGVCGQQENCPSGWTYFDRHCYQQPTSGSRYYTWESARSSCTGAAGYLVSINSEEERAHLLNMFTNNGAVSSRYIYIGLRIGADGVAAWDDGRKVTFTNWAPGQGTQPNTCGYIHYSDAVGRDLWRTVACNSHVSYHMYYVCKRPTACGPSASVFYYQNRCYTPINTVATRAVANSVCRQSHRSELLSLHSENEMLRVTNWASVDMSGGGNQWLYIGLKSTFSQPFQWSDRSHLDYMNWVQGEPLVVAKDRCVEMYLATGSQFRGKWRIADCSTPTRRFICARDPDAGALVPREDDKASATLLFGPKTSSKLLTISCLSEHVVIRISHKLADPQRYTRPCLVGRVREDEFPSPQGNPSLSLKPDHAEVPGGCRCTATNNVDSGRWEFAASYSQCGTATEELVTGRISFRNTIFARGRSPEEVRQRHGHIPVPLSDSDGSGHNEPSGHVRIGVSCDFPAVVFNSAFGYVINVFSSRTFNIAGVGSFRVTSSFIDTLLNRPLEADIRRPASFDIQTPIVFQLELHTSVALNMRPLQCWLSTGDYRQYPRAYFIHEGCPAHADVSIGSTSWRNHTSRYMRLSYNAFAFQGQEQATYYQHCTFRICSPQNNAPCRRECVTGGRRRRAAEHENGPVDGKLTISSQSFFYRPSASPDINRIRLVVPDRLPTDIQAGSAIRNTVTIGTLFLAAAIATGLGF